VSMSSLTLQVAPFSLHGPAVVIAGFKTAQLASAGLSTRIEIIINKKVRYITEPLLTRFASHALLRRPRTSFPSSQVLFYSICVSGEFIACALFTCLAWNHIIPPKESLADYCESHKVRAHDSRGLVTMMQGGGRPLSHVITTSQQCPTYTHQMMGGASNGMTLHGAGHGYANEFQHRGEETKSPDTNGNQHECANNYAPPSACIANRRSSTNTLSTISEVRYSSCPSLGASEPGRRGSCDDIVVGGSATRLHGHHLGGKFGRLSLDAKNGGSPKLIIPPTWSGSQQQQQYGIPPPSATESVRSHWSDDSEDDKKGSSGLFTLVKSTRDSLTRKSSKGSRTSSNKTEKGSGNGEKEGG
jgi:hypothetical protein